MAEWEAHTQSNENRPEPAQPKTPACRHLRVKNYYYQADGQELAASAIGSYWCLRTLRPDGPDLDLVEPKSCRPGRTCYEEE